MHDIYSIRDRMTHLILGNEILIIQRLINKYKVISPGEMVAFSHYHFSPIVNEGCKKFCFMFLFEANYNYLVYT